MTKIYTVLFLTAATFALINYTTRQETPANTPTPQTSTAQKFTLPQIAPEQYIRNELASGGVLLERVPAQHASAPQTDQLNQIAPASGENASLNVFYEPLTKTFRRTVIDSNGNTRQEIIKHPANR